MYFLLNKCKSQQDLNPTEQFVLFRIFNLVTILPKSEDKKAMIFLAPSNLNTSLLVFVCCYFFAFSIFDPQSYNWRPEQDTQIP